jgi:hypothetical protein
LFLSAFILFQCPFARFAVHRFDGHPSGNRQNQENRECGDQFAEPEFIAQKPSQTMSDAAEQKDGGYDNDREACDRGHHSGSRLPEKAAHRGPQHIFARLDIEVCVLDNLSDLLEDAVKRMGGAVPVPGAVMGRLLASATSGFFVPAGALCAVCYHGPVLPIEVWSDSTQ